MEKSSTNTSRQLQTEPKAHVGIDSLSVTKPCNSNRIRFDYSISAQASHSQTRRLTCRREKSPSTLSATPRGDPMQCHYYENYSDLRCISKIQWPILERLPAYWSENSPEHSWSTHQIQVTSHCTNCWHLRKAFLMIQIANEDRDVLRFLWVRDVTKDQPELLELHFTCSVAHSKDFNITTLLYNTIYPRYNNAWPFNIVTQSTY